MTRFAESVEAPGHGSVHVQVHEFASMPPVTVAVHVAGGFAQTYLTPVEARLLADHLLAAAARVDVREGVAA